MTTEIEAIRWQDDAVVLLDQTRLPGEVATVTCTEVDSLVDAVRRLVVRGAPALGAVGAYGVAVAMLQAQREEWTADRLDVEVDKGGATWANIISPR